MEGMKVSQVSIVSGLSIGLQHFRRRDKNRMLSIHFAMFKLLINLKEKLENLQEKCGNVVGESGNIKEKLTYDHSDRRWENWKSINNNIFTLCVDVDAWGNMCAPSGTVIIKSPTQHWRDWCSKCHMDYGSKHLLWKHPDINMLIQIIYQIQV